MDSDDMTLFALTLTTLALIAVAVELEMLTQELHQQTLVSRETLIVSEALLKSYVRQQELHVNAD